MHCWFGYFLVCDFTCFRILLQPLLNFQLPQPEDDFDYYANSSQDESRGSPGTYFVIIIDSVISDLFLANAPRVRNCDFLLFFFEFG